jgi:hypothetical protein
MLTRFALTCVAFILIIIVPFDKNAVPSEGKRPDNPTPLFVSRSSVVVQDATTDYRIIEQLVIACGELLEGSRSDKLSSINLNQQIIPIFSFRGRPNDYYSNSIYIHHSNVTNKNDLERIAEVNKAFLTSLGSDLVNEPKLHNARFITLTKTPSGEFVTVFDVKDRKFGALAVKLEAPSPHGKKPNATMAEALYEALEPWLAPIAGKGRLYLIGDDLDRVDPTQLAQRFNCDVIRRSSRVLKSLKETETRLAELESRRLNAAKMIYVNGLPRTEAEAVASGYQRSQAKELQRTAADMDEIAKRFFNNPSLPSYLPADLQNVFTNDDSDVVLILAHSDRERIFFNGKPITIEQLNAFPDRIKPSARPRICVLLSCNSGNLQTTKGWWLLRRNVDSLAELLVRKGYFDKVIAPRGERSHLQR